MLKFWIVPAVMLAVGGTMLADTITNTTGTFSPFPNNLTSSTPTWINALTQPATTGTPFWNNPSDDTGVGGSHMMNIGYALTATGGFTGTSPVLGTETVSGYLADSGGTDPTAFSFVRDQTAYQLAMLFARSSLDLGTATVGTVFGTYTGSTLTPIYVVGNTDSPMSAQAFDPTAAGNTYGFYATVCYGVGICETYTTGGGNWGNVNGAAAWNHFALFQLTDGNYAIGFTAQDAYVGEELGDFNDVIVELFAVPEPGTIAMIGAGLAGLSFLRRRSIRKS